MRQKYNAQLHKSRMTSRGAEAHHWSMTGNWKLGRLGAAGRAASRSAAAGSPASLTRVDMTDSRSGGKGKDCTMSLAHCTGSRTCAGMGQMMQGFSCCYPRV